MLTEENVVKDLYEQFIKGWNIGDADVMMEPFAEDGELIGYDGSQYLSRQEAISSMQKIFTDHKTASFVAKVKDVRFIGTEVAILRAIAGMIPPGQSSINPSVNTHHTVIANKKNEDWQIVLFQNTPAQFHGRPELVHKMTEELQALL